MKNNSLETLDVYTYCDGLGRVIQTKKPYDEGNGGPIQWIASGKVEYDNLGRVKRAGHPVIAQSVIPTDYEEIFMINPSTNEYDFKGRVTNTILPDGSENKTEYGIDYTISIDANENKKKSIFDSFGRVINIIEYHNAVEYNTRYRYDLLGQLTNTIDNENNEIKMRYDKLGRKIYMHDPDMGIWQYKYDKAGNLTNQIDAKTNEISFQYDDLGRLIKKDYADTNIQDIFYSYDDYDGTPKTNSLGKLTKVIDNSGTNLYYYDNMGNIIKDVKKIKGDKSYTNIMGYDALGKITNMIYPDGECINYRYNKVGLLNAITNTEGQPYLKNIFYDIYGQRTIVSNGNGSITEYEYNPVTRRLKQIKTSTNGINIQHLVYKFDKVGNITHITDNIHNSITKYSYDTLYRLTHYEYTNNNGGPKIIRNYQYSSIGNMMHKDGIGDYTYGAGNAGPHAVTAAGSYTFNYDLNGNMLYKANGNITNYYSWNADNRLKKVTNSTNLEYVKFIYDYTGSRVKKINSYSGDTIYASSFFEIKQGIITNKHIFDGVRRIVSRQNDGSIFWYHTDHLGSTALLTDDTGAVVQDIGYYPYGETRTNIGTGSATNIQYKFTGQEYDPETGLYYYGARYYDPILGRFISADTIIPGPFDPQAFNRYTYVRNNPIVYSDPSGNFPVIGAILFVVGTLTAADYKYGIFDHKLSDFMDNIGKWIDDLFGGQTPNIYGGETEASGEGSEPDRTYTDPTTGSGGTYNEGGLDRNIDEAIGDYNNFIDYLNYTLTPPILMDIYQEWKGVPYLWGGNTKEGIDCSHFVWQVYMKYGYPYPYGATVDIGSIRHFKQVSFPHYGDVVVWRTFSFRASKIGMVGHTGISLGQGSMMHSGGKSGVSITTEARIDRYYQTKPFFFTRKEYYRYKYNRRLWLGLTVKY